MCIPTDEDSKESKSAILTALIIGEIIMKLKATEVVEAVLHNLIHCVESTPLIIGSPAIGKTALSYSVLQLYADYLKLKVIRGVRGIPEHNITPKKNELGYCGFRLGPYETIDFGGVPIVEKTKDNRYLQKRALLDNLPTDPNSKGILLCDEIPQASPALQNIFRQLIFEGRIGTDYKLPIGWKVLMAGNLSSDRAGSNRLLTHFQSACLRLELIPDPKEWLNWAYQNDIHADILAFISFQPQFLHQFDPKQEGGFPAPRTWHQCSEFLSGEPRQTLIQPVLEAYLGEVCAREYLTFVAFQNDLESPKKILSDPKKAKLPERTELQYASVASLLSAVKNSSDFDNALTYVNRFDAKEYAVLFVKALTTKKKSFKKTSVFLDWHIKNQDILV